MFGIFKNRKAEKNQADRDLIAANSGAVEALVILAYNDELKAQLKDIKEEIKYIIPLVADKAYTMDKKISGIIGDLKIEFTKYDGEEKSSVKIGNMIRDLKVAIAERKALI